jgi:hypothetical protein
MRVFGCLYLVRPPGKRNGKLVPVRGRLSQSYLKGESAGKSLIRSSDIYGRVTQYDLLSYFENESLGTSTTGTGAHTTSTNIIPTGNADPLNATLYSSEYLSQFTTPVPVQSCFGGFAMYNATKFFHSRCSYSAPYRFFNQEDILKRPRLAHEEQYIFERYSSKRSKRPCEHVVFHKCLHRVYKGTATDGNGSSGIADTGLNIGVLPSWRTEWDAPLPRRSHTFPASKSRHEGMNTYYNQRLLGERLISKSQQYTLRINEEGLLVLEEWNNPTTKETGLKNLRKGDDTAAPNDADDATSAGNVVWTVPVDFDEGSELKGWTHMFLWLQEDGVIKLIKHVPLPTMMDQHSSFHKDHHCQDVKSEVMVSRKAPCICQVKIDGCEILVWSSSAPAVSSQKTENKLSFELVLNDDASIKLSDKKTGTAISTIKEARMKNTLPK